MIFAEAQKNQSKSHIKTHGKKRSRTAVIAIVASIVASSSLDLLLSGESSSVGTDVMPNIAYYWAGADMLYGYLDFLDSVENFQKWNDDGSGKPRQSGLPTDRKIAVFLRYNDGYGCLEISRELGISFDSVYAAVKEAFPDSEPRI